jgi:hypothetical protein
MKRVLAVEEQQIEADPERRQELGGHADVEQAL